MPRGSEARVAAVIAWALLALSLGDWWTRLAANEHGFREQYFTADQLAWPTVIEDTVVRGHAFAGNWYLTPAPYFVPDAALFLGARAVFPTIEGRQYAVIVAQVLLLALALGFLCRSLDPGLSAVGPALTAVGVSLGLHGLQPFTAVLYPTFHLGAAILGATALGLVLRGPRRWWQGPAIAALLAAGTASDALMPIFFFGGALLLCVAWVRAWGWSGLLPLVAPLGWAVSGSVAGWAILRRVLSFPDHDHHLLRLGELRQNLAAAWAYWLAFDLWFRMVLVLGTLALVWVGLRDRSAPWRQATLALAGGVLATGVAVLASGNLVGGMWIRYLLWPGIAAVLGLLLLVREPARVRLAAVLGAAVAVVGSAMHAPQTLSFPTEAPPSELREDVACLERLARGTGSSGLITGYWQAKPIALFSTEGLSPAQFETPLDEPALHITSRAWYWPMSGFSMVVLNGLDRRAIDRQFGPEFGRERCGRFEVRVYRGAARGRLNALVSRLAVLPEAH